MAWEYIALSLVPRGKSEIVNTNQEQLLAIHIDFEVKKDRLFTHNNKEKIEWIEL